MSAMDVTELSCSLIEECFTPAGAVGRRSVYKDAVVSLGRNGSSEMSLRVSHGKETVHPLRDFKIYRRFLNEGKATISFARPKMNLMLSNCPPGHLASFLKTMALKLTAQTPQKRRPLCSKNSFEELSPLNNQDYERAEQKLSKQLHAVQCTPRRAGQENRVKRKPSSPQGKENSKVVCRRSSVEPGAPVRRALLKRSVQLSSEQEFALKTVLSGKNIFLTGGAGTGKSFLLRRIVAALPPESTFVTASTGAAAYMVGGSTLHAFAGIGSGQASFEQCLAKASRPVQAAKWRRCQHLIVDEISMIEADFFDKLEAIARAVRGNKKPFGGVQLILTGDFFQLPPVSKPGTPLRFCFTAKMWHRCVDVNLELVQVYRQLDPVFVQLLRELRLGRCPSAVANRLQSTMHNKVGAGGIQATRLCTHRSGVDDINKQELDKLNGDVHTFLAVDNNADYRERVNLQCPAPFSLQLKIGAQVMLMKNIDTQNGLVNGARGVVTGFQDQGLPVVRFSSGRSETISQEKWSINLGGAGYVFRRQIPLQLAWAISIHKSQGMSLDCVELSLSHVFEYGQAYVALSRARSLNGLRVLDFEPSSVKAHPAVVDFYRRVHFSQVQSQRLLVDL